MTPQQSILAAMVHKSGPVPWLMSEIADRAAQHIGAISNFMPGLHADGLITPIPLPHRGGAVAWQLTPQGAEAAPSRRAAPRADKAKPKCGGLADVAKIMAENECSHQDAYRLSIMRTDPAYHPGNRLPNYKSEQERVAERRDKARARVMAGIRQGPMTVNSTKDFARISWDMARFCLEGLVQEGFATSARAARGDVYTITDKGRK